MQRCRVFGRSQKATATQNVGPALANKKFWSIFTHRPRLSSASSLHVQTFSLTPFFGKTGSKATEQFFQVLLFFPPLHFTFDR